MRQYRYKGADLKRPFPKQTKRRRVYVISGYVLYTAAIIDCKIAHNNIEDEPTTLRGLFLIRRYRRKHGNVRKSHGTRRSIQERL